MPGMYDPKRVKAILDRNGLKALITATPTSVGYITGIFGHCPELNNLLPIVTPSVTDDGQPAYVIAILFADSPEQPGFVGDPHFGPVWSGQAQIKDVELYDLFRNLTPAAALRKLLIRRGAYPGCIGIDMFRLPAFIFYEFILDQLMRWKDASDCMREIRMVKTDREIERIQAVYKIADRCYEKIYAALRPGVTIRELAQIEIDVAIENDAAIFFQTINVRDADVFRKIPDSGYQLQDGNVACFDLGVYKQGYLSDYYRMASVGRSNPRVKEAYQLAVSTHRLMTGAIRPGAVAGDIFELGRKHLEMNGNMPEGPLLGHGLGVDVHEWPFITPGNSQVIEEGMVVNVEPWITGAIFEHPGAVTANGWNGFTNFGMEFFESL